MGMLSTRGGRIAAVASIGGIAAGIGLLAIALGAAFRPSIDRARRAYERRDRESAASIAGRVLDREPDNLEAVRVRARGLARLGRFRESIPLTARLGGERVEAEDLCLIGLGALDEHRSALGRLALEAARRLDPKHSEALDRLDRESRAPGRADRILAISGPSTLSERIVGLASTAPEGPGAVDVDPTLGRILGRDRATFLKLDPPAAARKSLARALLEEGRAREAREWLERIGNPGDPEADWLLSRAFLVGGGFGEGRGRRAPGRQVRGR
jgi:hypothetical protein